MVHSVRRLPTRTFRLSPESILEQVTQAIQSLQSDSTLDEVTIACRLSDSVNGHMPSLGEAAAKMARSAGFTASWKTVQNRRGYEHRLLIERTPASERHGSESVGLRKTAHAQDQASLRSA